MKRISLFVLLACVFYAVSAQPSAPQQVIDSLRREVRNAPDDTTRINNTVALSRMVPPEQFLSTIDPAFQIAKRGNYKNKEGYLYEYRGGYFYSIQRKDLALTDFLQAIKIFEDLKNLKSVANMCYNTAVVLAENERVKEAIPYMERSVRIRDSLSLLDPQLEALSRLGQYYVRLGDMQQAQPHFQKADSLIRQSDDPERLAVLHAELVIFYAEQRLYDSSLVHAQEALLLYEELKDTTRLLKSLVNFGILFNRFQRNDQALIWLDRALDLAEKNNNSHIIALACNALGDVFTQEEKADEALLYLEKAQRIFSEIKDQDGLASVAYSFGEFTEVQEPENYTKALAYYAVADSLGTVIQNAGIVIRSKTRIGQVLEKQGLYEEAIATLTEALEINNIVNYSRNTVEIKLVLGRCYLKTGKVQEAITVLEEACTYVRETKEWKNAVAIYTQLSQAYLTGGSISKAYVLLDTAGMFKDSLYDVTRNDLIAKYTTEFQVEEEKRKNAEKELKIAQQRNYLLLALLGLGGLFVLLLFFWRRSRRNKLLAEQSQMEVQELKVKHRSTLERLEENKQKYQQAVQDLEVSRNALEASHEKHEQTQEELARTKEMYEMLASAKDVLDAMIPLPDGTEYPIREIVYFKKECLY